MTNTHSNPYLNPHYQPTSPSKEKTHLPQLGAEMHLEARQSAALFPQKLLRHSLARKYMTSEAYAQAKVTSNIMYNEPKNLVSVFKDFLILDDFSEYLKREYTWPEAHERLPRIFEFYARYSKVFPNYVGVPQEAAFMYKNIERKQKVIDQRNRRLHDLHEAHDRGPHTRSSPATTLFDSAFHFNLTVLERPSGASASASGQPFEPVRPLSVSETVQDVEAYNAGAETRQSGLAQFKLNLPKQDQARPTKASEKLEDLILDFSNLGAAGVLRQDESNTFARDVSASITLDLGHRRNLSGGEYPHLEPLDVTSIASQRLES